MIDQKTKEFIVADASFHNSIRTLVGEKLLSVKTNLKSPKAAPVQPLAPIAHTPIDASNLTTNDVAAIKAYQTLVTQFNADQVAYVIAKSDHDAELKTYSEAKARVAFFTTVASGHPQNCSLTSSDVMAWLGAKEGRITNPVWSAGRFDISGCVTDENLKNAVAGIWDLQ